MELIRDIDACQSALSWRRLNRRLGMVIISGELHPGELTIVNECRNNSDLSVVCCYPKALLDSNAAALGTQAADDTRERNRIADQLEALKVDVLFAPPAAVLFPYGIDDGSRVMPPELGGELVSTGQRAIMLATLAVKLLSSVYPDRLFVGEKDYFAWLLHQRLLKEFGFPTELHTVPIVREADGIPAAADLEHLSLAQRQQATTMQQTLRDLAHAIDKGARNFAKLEQTAKLALASAGMEVIYVLIRDAEDLAPAHEATRHLRILARAELGLATLVDNLGLEV